MDCYSLSFHEKDLKERMSFKNELIYANNRLDELDSFGAKLKIITLGNHDIRLNRILSTDNLRDRLISLVDAGAVSVKSIPELLKLNSRGWEYKDYREHYKLGKLF